MKSSVNHIEKAQAKLKRILKEFPPKDVSHPSECDLPGRLSIPGYETILDLRGTGRTFLRNKPAIHGFFERGKPDSVENMSDQSAWLNTIEHHQSKDSFRLRTQVVSGNGSEAETAIYLYHIFSFEEPGHLPYSSLAAASFKGKAHWYPFAVPQAGGGCSLDVSVGFAMIIPERPISLEILDDVSLKDFWSRDSKVNVEHGLKQMDIQSKRILHVSNEWDPEERGTVRIRELVYNTYLISPDEKQAIIAPFYCIRASTVSTAHLEFDAMNDPMDHLNVAGAWIAPPGV